jgi:alkylhydroperoxidase/carboxymuconolactone decarboxylase family protein YurZ
MLLILPVTGAAQGAPLDAARQSFEAGDFAAARERLNEVFAEDPDNIQAKFMNAYCARELGDQDKFLNSVDRLRPRYSELSAAQREKLDLDYAIGSFEKRDFMGALAHADDFATSYPQSVDRALVREIGLLARLECGLKRAHDAKNYQHHRQEEKKTENWNAGLALCRQFEAALGDGESSSSLRSRFIGDATFKEKVWTAYVVAGKQEEIGQSPLAPDAEEREWRDAIYLKARIDYWPEEAAANRALAEAFCREAREPSNAFLVRRAVAARSFRRGYDMHNMATYWRANDQPGRADGATSESAANFVWYRSVCGELLTGHRSELTDEDVLLLEEDYLKSHYFEGRYPELLEAGREVAGRYPAGTKGWALGKVFEALALACRPEPDMEGAAARLDEVLARPVEDESRHENLNVMAAFWRAQIADAAKDSARVLELVNRVKESYPNGNLKTMMMKRFSPEEQATGEVSEP